MVAGGGGDGPCRDSEESASAAVTTLAAVNTTNIEFPEHTHDARVHKLVCSITVSEPADTKMYCELLGGRRNPPVSRFNIIVTVAEQRYQSLIILH